METNSDMNHLVTEQHEERVVLITGAARRIGASIARLLHASGLRVVLHYRSSAAAMEHMLDELNAHRPGSAVALQADLLQPSAPENLARNAIAQFGRLDFLVNNASSFYPTPFGKIRLDEWNDLIGSNLRAPLFLTQACAKALQRQGGAIVNIVDIHSLRPPRNYLTYTIAKAGLWTLTQGLAQELGPSVRVNGVAPGAILIPDAPENQPGHQAMIEKTPLQRSGNPEEIARSVRFLLLEASYITGQILPVDGGRSVVS